MWLTSSRSSQTTTSGIKRGRLISSYAYLVSGSFAVVHVPVIAAVVAVVGPLKSPAAVTVLVSGVPGRLVGGAVVAAPVRAIATIATSAAGR